MGSEWGINYLNSVRDKLLGLRVGDKLLGLRVGDKLLGLRVGDKLLALSAGRNFTWTRSRVDFCGGNRVG